MRRYAYMQCRAAAVCTRASVHTEHNTVTVVVCIEKERKERSEKREEKRKKESEMRSQVMPRLFGCIF